MRFVYNAAGDGATAVTYLGRRSTHPGHLWGGQVLAKKRRTRGGIVLVTTTCSGQRVVQPALASEGGHTTPPRLRARAV